MQLTKDNIIIELGTIQDPDLNLSLNELNAIKSVNLTDTAVQVSVELYQPIQWVYSDVKSAIKNKLNEIVKFHGRKNHQELKQYIQNATIGVCFVPQTSYYDVQPPTKIFEYALSGLITIATDTGENRKYINDVNGVICQDNENSFCAALEKVYESLGKYDDSKIRQSLSEYHWGKIVKNILLPILRN